MAVGDRQKLITDIVATVLSEQAHIDISFDWFINKHTQEHFQVNTLRLLIKIFTSHNEDKQATVKSSGHDT